MIKAEDKVKVVATVWGSELFHFFAAIAILNQDDLKNRIIWTRTI